MSTIRIYDTASWISCYIEIFIEDLSARCLHKARGVQMITADSCETLRNQLSKLKKKEEMSSNELMTQR